MDADKQDWDGDGINDGSIGGSYLCPGDGGGGAPGEGGESFGDIDCDDPALGGTLAAADTVDGNLTVRMSTTCTVDGKVDGNIFVLAGATLNLNGETNGNIEANSHVNLGDGALVRSDVIQKGDGTVDFAGDDDGAEVRGNVVMEDGILDAEGDSADNQVNGSIECKGGFPPSPGNEHDWDGDGSPDGNIDGDYKC